MVQEAIGYPNNAADLSPVQGMTGDYNTQTSPSYLSPAFYPKPNWCWPVHRQVHHTRPLQDVYLITWRQYWFQAFPFWQFHVLFNSLFKVLFIFPSRYLFAIGLSPLFSFGWNLPPDLRCIPKQRDSSNTYHKDTNTLVTDGILTLYDTPFQGIYSKAVPENASVDYNSRYKSTPDSKIELFPLHSPLLRESLLVSFPPLIDMLKFSG